MKINFQVVVFDTDDLATESAFWAAVLGGTIDVEDDWHMVSVDGEPRVGVQLAPDHVPPDWPHGSPQQIHVDLWVDDPAAADREVLALGARMLDAPDNLDAREGFRVYADPAGHPFCLCWLHR